MLTTQTISQTRAAVRALGPVAFVPTMGALHAGHMALVKRARQLAERVVVSIFVNPTQFGPNEDLSRYPRPLERDLKMCEEAGVDLVFLPGVDDIYPPAEIPVNVDVPSLTTILEGAHRPGHFVGVCRVVAKLFGIVQPVVACFGKKDYQQLKVIEAMTAGLSLPVKIVPCETVREPDGLAMSSRNVYLTPEQRPHALALSKALAEAKRLIREGETDPKVVESAMVGELRMHQVTIDYATVRDARTLQTVDSVNPDLAAVVCLIAARVGNVRLIDNVEVA
jgi:pantoate--beta-alanine ligase